MDYTAKYHEYALQAAAAYKNYTMTEEDTQECAEFLLTLKHRSVTPEPQSELRDCIESEPQTANDNTSRTESEPQTANYNSSRTKALNEDYDSIGNDNELQMPPALIEELSIETDIWKRLLGDSPLVFMADRDLVPDPLFVAMAQMKPCILTEADRVGCYKARSLGFTGMSCKHCEGQPGFGKYFPETVRSLAQTTTSQTILKHIGSKCRFCPPDVRKAVLDLQRQQIVKESTNSGRPRYGSRKVFFHRVWSRLHNLKEMSSSDYKETSEKSEKKKASCPDVNNISRTANTMSSSDSSPNRKFDFSRLPTKRKLKKRKNFSDLGISKRTRVEWTH